MHTHTPIHLNRFFDHFISYKAKEVEVCHCCTVQVAYSLFELGNLSSLETYTTTEQSNQATDIHTHSLALHYFCKLHAVHGG